MADIFVSYTSADRDWAFWIAKELEKLGHAPHIHEWEIPAGGNIPAWMEERHQKANHILCVISKAYLAAPYSSWERQAAQWVAVTKRPNFALPVFVEDCEALTLLAQFKRCDLHGISEDQARARLVAYLEPAVKPAGPARFPGGAKSITEAPKVPETVVFPGGRYALSNIPISVPLHFLGREDVLKDIKTALSRGDGRVAITALHGLRGVGKTTLAAAYADKHRGDYRATWWIRAQTDSTMRADLVSLGVRLGWVAADEKEAAAVGAVQERLRHEGDGILLIFDNANGANEVRPYLPRGGNSQILITSTAPDLRQVAALVEIEVWPDEIGADYLVEATGRTKDREMALALSGALGGLPLAHEQAAAYCVRLGISLADYHKRFESTPGPLLDDVRAASPDYHGGMTVAKTFALAINEAAKLHPAAAPLIEHAALLAPEPIPLFLFAEAREKFDEPFDSELAGDGLDEAVAALRTFALIEREIIADERDPAITTDCIRLHRLVREVAAALYDGEARDGAQRALVRAFAEIYPTEVFNNPAVWPRARRLDTLAMALLAPGLELPDGVEQQASRILDRLASYRQSSLAAYSEARSLFERALAIDEKVFGAEHSDTAAALNNLAAALRVQNDFAAARPLLERALAINEKVHGPDHPETAACLNNLAMLLMGQDDLAAARPLLERALAIQEKMNRPEHPDTATCLNNLALLMRRQGDHAAARPLYARALAIQEKMSPEHPATATCLVNLGFLLRTEVDAAGALPMFRRALAIFEKVLGPEHPSTKNAAGHTIDALDDLGRADEAKALGKKYRIEA